MHTIAMNTPPQQTFPLVWGIAMSYFQQQDPGHRKAAMLGVATMVEGCSDHIRNEFKLENVIPVVVQGLGDPDMSTRRAACIALTALANEMGDDLAEFHAVILPIVFTLLEDADEQIRNVALEALDTIVESLGENIKPYLNILMEKLVTSLDTSPMERKITITSAIGSAAHAAETAFQPFFPHVIQIVQSYMALSNTDNEDEMTLRAVATDTAAAIASAVGKEMFAVRWSNLLINIYSNSRTCKRSWN